MPRVVTEMEEDDDPQLAKLNAGLFTILDDGKLNEERTCMFKVRTADGDVIEVFEDVVNQSVYLDEAMSAWEAQWEARKRKARRVAKKRARAARASDGSDEAPAAAAAQEALPVVEDLCPESAASAEVNMDIVNELLADEMAAASPASLATVVTPAASASSSSSAAAAADPDEDLKAKRDALRDKRRRLDAEEAAVQAELEKRAKKRCIQAALDAAEARAAAAAAECDRLRAELESA